MLANMEQEMQVIKKNLKASHDRQKSYEDQNKLFKEFHFWEHVYLRIKPKKSSLWIGSCAKLAPRLCGHFSIIERIGPIVNQLALPPTMKVYDVFHVSLLKNSIKVSDHVIDWSVLHVEPYGELQLEPQRIFQKRCSCSKIE